MPRAIVFLTICIMLRLTPAVAAAPGPTALERLTLGEAHSLMVERNRELQLARHATAGAEADITIANARPNPSLNIGAARIGAARDPDAGPLPKRIDTVIGVTQLFERGGKRAIRTEAAQYSANAARSEQADVQRQQRIAVDSAYFDLVLAQEKVSIASENARTFDNTIDAAERRVKAGDLSRADLARLKVDALRAQNELQNTRLEEEKAKYSLGYLIGVERDARRIRAADNWPTVLAGPSMTEIDALVDRRPDVQASRARLNAAQKNAELARSLRTRDVTAGVQYDRQPRDVVRNSLSFNVSVPLFVNYYYQGEIRKAEAEYDAAQTTVDRARAVGITQISAAAAGLSATAERVQRFRRDLLAAAQLAADAAEFAYTRGAIGVMDLLDARRQLYAVRIDAAAAFAEYARANSAWNSATAQSVSTP